MEYANKVILMVAVMLILFSHASLYPKADKDDDGQKKLYEYTVNGIDSPPSGDLAPYSVTFSSEKPFRVFIFRAITPGSQFLIYVVPDDYFDYAPITYVRTYDGNPLPTETVDHLANDHSFFCYGFVRGENASVDKPYQYFTARSEINQILNDYYNGNKDAYQPDTNLPPVDLEKDGTFSEDIPVPHLTFNEDNADFVIDNASDAYFVQIIGRWWSVDYVELYKDGLDWYINYNTDLVGDLTDWVSPNDKRSSEGRYNLYTIGDESKVRFLSEHPLAERTISGGTDLLGNFVSGYNRELAAVKIMLENPGSPYFTPEIYVRFFYIDSDGAIHYGRWCHWYKELADYDVKKGTYLDFTHQSANGLTPDQFDSLQHLDHSLTMDTDAELENNSYNNHASGKSDLELALDGTVDNSLSNFITMLEGMSSSVNRVIPMVTTFFSWLPGWVSGAIGAAIVVIVILRILGR